MEVTDTIEVATHIVRALAGIERNRTEHSLYNNAVDVLDSYFHRTRAGISSDPSLQRSISTLWLSGRAANCLTNGGIASVAELVARSADDLLELRNFGRHCLTEVTATLQAEGLKLSDVSIRAKRIGSTC